MKVKKGDTVIILSGRDKGKTGSIQKVLPKKNAVIVTGINMLKRHTKKRDEKRTGGILDIIHPIHVSNVALVDKKSKKPTRIGYIRANGEKMRVSKRSGDYI
jgi:large subunit ribosomal protein L24